MKDIVPVRLYKDQIWKIYDDDSEELIWENNLRKEMWGNNDAPDSEYNKMCELERETHFWEDQDELDYWFEHRTICVETHGENKGKEQVIRYQSLLVEFANI